MKSKSTFKPTFISFFHGVGGMSIGAERAGWRSILASDNWDTARQVFELNNQSGSFLLKDFNELDTDEMISSVSDNDRKLLMDGELDCIISGSPCQGMSKANLTRSIYDKRNYLMLKQILLSCQLKPKVMWFEQVPGLQDFSMKPLYLEVLALLNAQTDYHFSIDVLNAMHYDSNQSRERVTIIMVRKDVGIPSFPKPKAVDMSRQSVGSLLPHIIEFRRKKGGGELDAKTNVAPTLTATNEGMQVRDEYGWRGLSIQERLKLSCLERHNFGNLSEVDIVRLAGNMVQIPFAEAVMRYIKDEILVPYHERQDASRKAA